jgi:hypothetical protein
MVSGIRSDVRYITIRLLRRAVSIPITVVCLTLLLSRTYPLYIMPVYPAPYVVLYLYSTPVEYIPMYI